MAKKPQTQPETAASAEASVAPKNLMKMVNGEPVEMTDEEQAEWLASIPREDFFATLRVLRDAAIWAGIVVGGVAVYTDELSQQRITGAAVAAMLDQSLTINWKSADGTYVTLDAPTILAVATAVRQHVQACFDNEAALIEALNASAKSEDVDLSQGWPKAPAVAVE